MAGMKKLENLSPGLAVLLKLAKGISEKARSVFLTVQSGRGSFHLSWHPSPPRKFVDELLCSKRHAWPLFQPPNVSAGSIYTSMDLGNTLVCGEGEENALVEIGRGPQLRMHGACKLPFRAMMTQ